MSSPSLRPLIDTCQKFSTSPANHEPRSPANGSFQNPGVCPQAVPSFPSPTPTVLFLALAPFSAQAKYRKPRSSVFLCSQTLRKRLLRRLLCERLPFFDARILHQKSVTGKILFTTHTAGFLSLQLYSGGEQPTPQEEVFTASVSRVEKLYPSLQDRSIYAKQLSNWFLQR